MSGLRTLLALVAIAFGLGAQAHAQPQQGQGFQYGQRGADGYQAPAGTYQQSCRNLSVVNGLLRGSCTNVAGAQVQTQIVISACQGRDIMNDNGRLTCGAPVAQAPQPPAGSYRQSCERLSMRGTVLSAQCRRTDGRLNPTSLDTATCRGAQEVYNDNGALRCGGNAGPLPPPRPQPVPAGSYQQSCRDASLRGNILTAQCQRSNRMSVTSSIDVNTCRNRDIYNDDGRLSCDDRRGRAEPFEAVVYTAANYRGQQLLITEPIADLATRPGFNNAIRSIRVLRGSPELCVDPQFRGQCRVLRESVSDLAAMGLAGNVSSLRGADDGNTGRGRGRGRDDRY